ncbi:MAG: hypothetical protein M0Q92_09335 [Methanoregula sp.]|jgi:epoxyqueuosine reductase|nr:hypothetical protein [Methanoregula sp.]
MSAPSPGTLTADVLPRFFAERKIPAFCSADTTKLRAPPGRHPREILTSCNSIILFGALMTDRLFTGSDRERAEEMHRLTGLLESTARDLEELLLRQGAASSIIPPSLPFIVADGKLRGLLSLKHCAADAGFGALGDNALLIHPFYGNRLALAAVITEMAIAPTSSGALPACTHCGRCRAACPAGALGNGVFEITLCKNLTDYVPQMVRPLAWRLMRGKYCARFITWALNRVAPWYDLQATCTACMTACPHFKIPER